MPKTSAGVLMFRKSPAGVEVLLVHPGGPYWRNKDEGAWTIPKGEVSAGEEPLAAARRELEEETGLRPEGPFTPLGPVKQKGGKLVLAWICEGDCDRAALRSNTFTMEWPPRSGRMAEFPEVDGADFFGLDAARKKINAGQIPLLDELQKIFERRQAHE